jgi:hypothetical protein
MLEKAFCMLAQEDELSNFMTTQKLSDEKERQSKCYFMFVKL